MVQKKTEAKKNVAKEIKKIKKDYSDISYTLGIVSIVLAVFSSLAGLILGLIGLSLSRKQNTEISGKAKKLNTIGIILSLIFLIITVAIAIYASTKGISNFNTFPIG